ncbi:MAG: iron ABC transporter permease [Campylobacterales bacterium]|nr:iron ABC transporter permease [Campylobacterales bacterium]
MRYLAILISFIILISAPFFGQVDMQLANIFDFSSSDAIVFWDIRSPRVVLAFFVGGILALGGLVFQTIFRNPMSTPFTLGVASGATLFTAIAIVLGLMQFISIFAFIGAIVTVAALFVIASRLKGTSTASLLLVGIALSFFYSACLMVMFFISDLHESYEIVRFTMGSLDVVGFDSVAIVTVVAIGLLVLILSYKYELKLLLTSHEFAMLKGLDLKKTNYILLLCVSVAVGVAVSITGPIGFIGLIVPHILKLIYKKSAEKLIVPIFFYGGVFLVFCDLIARNLGTVSDIPIGVVTSFLGAPFFIYLIMRQKRGI